MNGKGRTQVLASLTAFVNEVKQKAPDLFEYDRLDFPIELSLTAGEVQRILLDCCHIDGFLKVLKEHGLSPIDNAGKTWERLQRANALCRETLRNAAADAPGKGQG